MRDSFGNPFVPASEATRSATALLPINGAIRYLPDGTRTVHIARPVMGGTTSFGVMKPTSIVRDRSDFHQNRDVHRQGSRVDYFNYLKTLEMNQFENLQIRSGAPYRNKSSSHIGDRYYYNGAHMFESSYQEFISQRSSKIPSSTSPTVSPNHPREEVHLPGVKIGGNSQSANNDYRAATAIVGQARLSKLVRTIRYKFAQWAIAGTLDDLIRACTPKTRQGEQDLVFLMPESLLTMSRLVGIDMSLSDAKALFGLFDHEKLGEIESKTLIKQILGEYLARTPT